MTPKKGKAKSAVSGRYVSKADAAADPERTYVSKAKPHRGEIALSLSDLKTLIETFNLGNMYDPDISPPAFKRINKVLHAAYEDASRKAKKKSETECNKSGRHG